MFNEWKSHAGKVWNSTEKPIKKLTRMTMGLGPTLFAANAADQFRRFGWDVAMTANGEEARKHAIRNHAQTVVIPVSTEAEGGMLAMAKTINAMPANAKVILVSVTRDPRIARFAKLIGARFVSETDGVPSLLRAVTGNCGVLVG